MPGVVRVAAAQIEAGQDVAENLAACLRVIDAAAAQGAQLGLVLLTLRATRPALIGASR